MAELESLADLLRVLVAATDAHEAAQRHTSIARNEENTALNRLNDAQKRIDALIDEQRKKAPRDSDWGQQRILGVKVLP